jgi:hypothetical protein
MAPIDDELAVRSLLSELTANQPPPPPGRYPELRRRIVTRRRRQLAGAGSAVVVLTAAAIVIPLGLRHPGPQPPAASRHYRVSEYPPGPGAPPGLLGTGRLNTTRWTMTVYRQGQNLCWGVALPPAAGRDGGCTSWPPPAAGDGGIPADNLSAVGTTAQFDIGTARRDVSYLKIFYTNGQVLTARTVAAFGPKYTRFFAFPAPDNAAVTRVAAYARTGEIAYVIPFTRGGNIDLVRWMPAGAPSGARPATAVLTSTVAGQRLRQTVYYGPWGTCVVGTANPGNCLPGVGWLLGSQGPAGVIGTAYEGNSLGDDYGQADPDVAYLIMRMAHGGSARVGTVAVGRFRFFSFAFRASDPVTGWVAYDAGGHRLGAGRAG